MCTFNTNNFFCTGLSNFNLNCSKAYSNIKNSTSLAQVTKSVCKPSVPKGCIVDIPSFIGDFRCDSNTATYNSAICGYDGGDCCQTSCLARATAAADIARCGSLGYNCRDPNSS